MPDRFTVQEICEIGVESTPGTGVPSKVKLSGLVLELDTALEGDRIAPSGSLFDTIYAPRQEWATGSLSGFPTYTELPYVFSNVFGAATITTPSGGTTAKQWAWAPSSAAPWTPLTWTIRRGMVGNTAEMATYGIMSGVNMSFSRTSTPEIGGDFFAKALDYAGVVGSTGMTALTLQPILPGQVCVYMDPTAAALGTTKLTRDFLASFDISGLFGPFWPLDCQNPSFGGHAPLKPDAGATLQLGNDAQARALVVNMRAGSTVYVRVEATGPIIETTIPYRLRLDMALKVVSAPTRGDSDGLSTLEWGFGIFDDPTFGGAIKIQLINNLSAL